METPRIARVLDYDGTLVRKLGDKTLLEKFLLDFRNEQRGLEKLNLSLRGTIVKGCRQTVKSLCKIFDDDNTITGESTVMQVCDLVYIKHAKIPEQFLRRKAKEYAEYLNGDVRFAIKNCKDDVYIVSSEPVQLLELTLKFAGLSESIKKVYGTKFKFKDGYIAGFDRLGLFAGIRGKYLGLYEISTKNPRYDLIFALGDSTADKGLYEGSQVIPCTFSNAPLQLQDYVRQNYGKIVNNVTEFFALDAKQQAKA